MNVYLIFDREQCGRRICEGAWTGMSSTIPIAARCLGALGSGTYNAEKPNAKYFPRKFYN